MKHHMNKEMSIAHYRAIHREDCLECILNAYKFYSVRWLVNFRFINLFNKIDYLIRKKLGLLK